MKPVLVRIAALLLGCATAGAALAQQVVIDEFPLPTPGSQPGVIIPGPDGNFFFTERNADQLGRVTPAGVIVEVPTRGILTALDGLAFDSSANLWFTESATNAGGIIRTNSAISTFRSGSAPPPCSPEASPRGIANGPDANLWVVLFQCNAILRFPSLGPTPGPTAGNTFVIPTSNAGPLRITAGPDGALWFTQNSANKIGRITTAGAITEFVLPTAGSGPHGIAAGPDGALWFTQNVANRIGRITTAGVITEFTIPTTNSAPTEIVAGPDGALWFTEFNANKIGRITTAGAITEYPVPSAGSGPSGIAAGPVNTLWFTEALGNRLGRITLIATVPGAPTGVSATAGNAQASVSFTAPASNGGASITQYLVTSSPGTFSATGAGSPVVVSGLANGTAYAFSVRAQNSAGLGAASTASNSVTPAGPDLTPPSVPQGLRAAASGPDWIELRWNSSSDNVGVTQYQLYRDGGLAATLGNVTSYFDAGLPLSSAYSYSIAACDAAANCSVQSSALPGATRSAGQYAIVPELPAGFGQLGNGFSVPLDVAALYGNQSAPVAGISDRIDAVWAWNAATQKWKFFSPQLTNEQNANHAAANDFEVLASIPAGEGYWVNAYQAFSLPTQTGAGFAYDGAAFGARPPFWNLLAIAGAGMAPPQFNAAVGAGPANFDSLWMWDPARAKWYFHSPLLESGEPFTNCQYATQNNLLDFGGCTLPAPPRTLGLGQGFWVYRR